MNPTSEELAIVILARMGLMPRKKGATEKMHRVLLEFYERAKASYRMKQPHLAVMTVEEMGYYAGITRQTMYDYLHRWTALKVITKTTYIADSKVVVGYKLNGNTLEQTFERSTTVLQEHIELTKRYISELQRLVKNEKIAEAQQRNNEVDQPEESDQKVSINA